MKAVALAAVLALGAGVASPVLAETPPAADQVAPAREEAALRTVIAQFQAGKPDYDQMEPRLADAVKAQPAVVTMVQGFGALEHVDYVGVVNGAQHFRVGFATAETDWFIALSPAGKIAGLVFRPAA
ncbi:hypothetical protein [Caulobacter sp. 17J80-11]|uniref:hypothetical protein n=1 Tax=Caulobacter sp. 17J80-11 TaxID=2763502 RepID=UPI0016536900|nr:hypothetical protein [Caulobacter sp. 17J80-11]MBC6982812.1 hypothetical protein [Caulobacter sp. 17J80-11]